MSESNNVYENFEDALFRLFMDRVAVVEGERLLRENEELKSDPDAAVPEVVQKRCLNVIKTTFERKKRIRAQKTGLRIMRFVVVAAAVIMMLGIAAFAAIPAFRAEVLNIILERENNRVDWEYVSPNNEESIDNSSDISFSLDVPDGYYISEHAKDEVHESLTYISRYDSSSYFRVLVIHGSDISNSTDIENVDYYEEFLINNKDIAIVTSKDECLCIAWTDSQKEDYISIITNDNSISIQQMIELAKRFY